MMTLDQTIQNLGARYLTLRALKSCALSVAHAAQGDLGMAKLHQVEMERTIDIIKGEYPRG